ncbi:MAG TPA: lamin tail domain-containing protein [Kofleriaceae bacterium]|nr:lamin tail domain-containing protein [Kofleriaceae bacterium]
MAGAVALGGCAGCDASSDANPPGYYAGTLSDVVISQVFGGGGSSGTPFASDYVELFNRSGLAVTVTGWSVQYSSASGSSWAKANLSGTIPAGGYYLVAMAGGASGASLPAPDASGSISMSASSGKVALVTNQTLLTCGASACLPSSTIRDFVGYGSANQAEGGATAPTLSATTATLRAAAGCTDTDNNRADFTVGAPAPRNSASALTSCGAPPSADAGVGGIEAGTGGIDASTGGDGTPTRLPCTSSFGSAMNTTFGRLDGFLVSIVNPAPSGSGCASDAHHVHLQILVNGGVEDIAVNVDSSVGTPDVDFLQLNAPLHGAGWLEGWHPSQAFDYANDLGVHSGAFSVTTPTQLTQILDTALASANHVSIFCTGFDATGGHLVHRHARDDDGAIVINPLSASPTYLLFHFADQTF